MLESLDEIPWATLHHAYGSATDVPGLIRRIAISSGDDLEEAWCELWGNLVHQGTVYEATAYAVPFFVELLGRRETPIRTSIAQYLQAIATGTSYADVHGPDVRGSILPHNNALAKELVFVDRAAEAVAASSDLYWSIVENDQEESGVRGACLWLLHHTRRQNERLQREIHSFLSPGQPIGLRSWAALIAGYLPTSEALTHVLDLSWETERDVFARKCLAFARICSGQAAVGSNEASIILEAYLTDWRNQQSQNDGSNILRAFRLAVPHALRDRNVHLRDAVLSELLKRLQLSGEGNPPLIVDAVLEIGFDPIPFKALPLQYSDLTDQQITLLNALVDCDDAWPKEACSMRAFPRGIPA